MAYVQKRQQQSPNLLHSLDNWNQICQNKALFTAVKQTLTNKLLFHFDASFWTAAISTVC